MMTRIFLMAAACAAMLEADAFVADVTKFGAKGDGVTDDTAAVQRAIDAVAAAGGGKVYLPYTTNGYLIASPGRATDAAGRPVRAQLIIPAGRATIGFEGEMPCKFLYEYQVRPKGCEKSNFTPTRFGRMGVPNTMLHSTWDAPEVHDPNERPWAVIAAPEGKSCTGLFSMPMVSIKNLEIRAHLNKEKMYPTTSAANLHHVSRIVIEDSQFCLDDNVGDTELGKYLVENPCHTVGLHASGDQNDQQILRDVAVQGFKYGFVLGEHIVADHLYVHNCEQAVVFHDSTHLSRIGMIVAQHNNTILATSRGNLFGNKPARVNVQIDLVNLEGGQTTGVPPFVSHLKWGVSDPDNRLCGSLVWHEPWGANVFPIKGAANFQIRRFGTAGASRAAERPRDPRTPRSAQRPAANAAAVSPDGRNAIAFDLAALAFSVTRDGKTVVGKSPVGLTVDGAALGGEKPVVTTNAVRGTVATPVYKKSAIVLDRNETFVDYGTWGLRLAARDDGVAYRFETKMPGRIRVDGERFALTVPDASARCWTKPTWSFGCEEMIPFAETAKDVKTTNGGMLTLPFVYRTEGTTVAVVESDVCDYPVLNLARPSEAARLPVVFESKLAPWPKTLKRAGVAIRVTSAEDYLVETDGTRTFPWRGFVLCEEPMKLAEADLVNALARPQTQPFDWVKPGLVAWDWWNCFDNAPKGSPNGGCTTATYERFIGFAQRHGLPYVIFDAGWSDGLDIWKFNRAVDVPRLIAYAEKCGVGIILWMASSAVIGQEERVAEHFAKLGVKGFKVDFMDRGDAEMERFLWKFAEACRKNRMVVDYHGAHRPTGMSRAYPNVLNYEGVHGLEMVKWYKGNDREMMFNDVAACFLRMTQGPLDYTPGAMLNYTPADEYRGSDVNPGAVGTRSRQMAMMAMYEAPLQMLCDSPTHYERNAESLAFMAATPTVWEDTVALGGTPDTYAALARRAKDGSWYAAALGNVEARDVKVDTKFLGGGAWKAEIFRDGPASEKDAKTYVHETKSVKAGDVLDMHLAACGGFVIRFTREREGAD